MKHIEEKLKNKKIEKKVVFSEVQSPICLKNLLEVIQSYG